MKVLLLSPAPPPIGGIASWTMNVIDYYKAHENIEIIHQDTAMKYREVTNLSFLSRVTSGVKDSLRTIIYFLNHLKAFKPNIIHLNSSGSLGLWKDLIIVFISRLHKIPVVIHFHFGRITEISYLNNWEWKALRCVISFCSAVIVLDKKSLEVLRNQDFRAIHIIPNPVSKYVEEFLFDDEKFNGTEDGSLVKVIFVGHVTKKKGVFELVEVCSLLSNIDELVLIGPYEEDVKNELLKISLSGNLQINFTGVVSKESVLAQMRTASMLVLPSYSEGFPNVIIEAMAMKCPVVATNVGAISSMLDVDSLKPAGIVIEPKTVKALAGAINLIITDKPKTHIFIQNAFSKVKEEYTLEKVSRQYEKVWKAAYQK